MIYVNPKEGEGEDVIRGVFGNFGVVWQARSYFVEELFGRGIFEAHFFLLSRIRG